MRRPWREIRGRWLRRTRAFTSWVSLSGMGGRPFRSRTTHSLGSSLRRCSQARPSTRCRSWSPGDAQPAGGGAGLGRLEHLLTAHLCAYFPDRQHARLQIHVLPPQAADLAGGARPKGRPPASPAAPDSCPPPPQKAPGAAPASRSGWAPPVFLGRVTRSMGLRSSSSSRTASPQGRGQQGAVLDDRVGGEALVHLLIEIALDLQGRQIRQRGLPQCRDHMAPGHIAVGVQGACRPVPGRHPL